MRACGTEPWQARRSSRDESRRCAGEVVAEAVGGLAADVFFRGSGAGEEDGGGGRLGALDALGVVVGDVGGTFGFGEGFLESVEGPTDGADAHGGAVAEGVVGARIVAKSQSWKRLPQLQLG